MKLVGKRGIVLIFSSNNYIATATVIMGRKGNNIEFAVGCTLYILVKGPILQLHITHYTAENTTKGSTLKETNIFFLVLIKHYE